MYYGELTLNFEIIIAGLQTFNTRICLLTFFSMLLFDEVGCRNDNIFSSKNKCGLKLKKHVQGYSIIFFFGLKLVYIY